MGATPKKLSEAVVAGIVIGICPIIGVTTALSIVVGLIFKLNQIVIQATNYLMYPVQIIMIPIYIKITVKIFNFPDVPVRPDLVVKKFQEGFMEFVKVYGMISLYSLMIWILIGIILLFVLRPVLEKSISSMMKKTIA